MNRQRWLEAKSMGAVDPDHAARYHGGGGKGGGSAPPQPDYTGAAREQGQASQNIAQQSNYANRPNISTPWGSQTWESSAGVDPSTGQPITNWKSNISLSPEEQASLTSQQAIQQGRSQAAQTLLGQATEAFQQPFDWNSMPAAPGSIGDAQQNAYQKMSALQEPGRTTQRGALDTRLANQGLSQGSEAFGRAKQTQADQFTREDQALQAQALAEGRADVGAQQGLRTAAIAEQAQRRGMNLNELNALLTGQQVNMPTMPNAPAAASGQAPDLLGAASAQGQYGLGAAQLAQQGGTNWGQLAGTGLMAGAVIL